MFKLIGISLILAVIQISESAPVYQFLPPRDGYVPVYIRLGNTPLDEINPDLASAFHESNIETRNVNDLEEQMQNDGPNNDDLSDSVEDSKDIVPIRKDSTSDEEPKPQSPVKSSDDETDSEETFEAPQKKSSLPDNKSEEDIDSEEVTALTQLTKGKDSEETVEPSTTNKTKSEDSSSEEVTKRKRNVTVPPPPPSPTKEDNSSEEFDDKVTEKKASTSYESKSSEEVENKS